MRKGEMAYGYREFDTMEEAQKYADDMNSEPQLFTLSFVEQDELACWARDVRLGVGQTRRDAVLERQDFLWEKHHDDFKAIIELAHLCKINDIPYALDKFEDGYQLSVVGLVDFSCREASSVISDGWKSVDFVLIRYNHQWANNRSELVSPNTAFFVIKSLLGK
jgi:hypothetical protein